jgi:hypothetical protein
VRQAVGLALEGATVIRALGRVAHHVLGEHLLLAAADLAGNDAQRDKVLQREKAVLAVLACATTSGMSSAVISTTPSPSSAATTIAAVSANLYSPVPLM